MLVSYFSGMLPHFQSQLLIQAHINRVTAVLSPDLQHDLKDVLQLAPRLLEELLKVSSATQ